MEHNANNRIRVAILDGHQSIIDGYLYRLRDVPDVRIVGAARYGEDLDLLLAAHPADVLILDVVVPAAADNANPFPLLYVLPRLVQAYPDLAILVVTGHLRRWIVEEVMQAGARGYILKDDHTTIFSLGNVIRNVYHGATCFSARALQLLFDRRPDDDRQLLTSRQREVLAVCAAYPNDRTRDLAARLHVAGSTLRNELSEVYGRLGVRNRAGALARARELALVATAAPELEPRELGAA